MQKGYANSFHDAIQKLAGTWNRDWINVIVATVTAVDAPSCTCSVLCVTGDVSGTTLDGVLLLSTVSDGITVIPSVGSTVVVVFPTKSTPFVTMYSGIDGIITVTSAGQKIFVGQYYDENDNGKQKSCEIQSIASTGEKVLIGNPANNSGGGIQVDASANGSKIVLNSGSSPATLGDKNVTALTDVYNMLTVLQTFATACEAATDPVLVAAATALANSLTSMLPQYNSDIQATTSQNVSLD